MNEVAEDWQKAVRRFGGLLGQLRAEAGLTMRELAAAIGVAPATVSKTESGGHARPPDFYVVRQWVTACAQRVDGRGGPSSVSVALDWWRQEHGQLERLHLHLSLRPLRSGDSSPTTTAADHSHDGNPQAVHFEVLHQKVVDHLADRSPHVRMAALRTLGDLGDKHHEKRQRIVNELCDYLRIPPDTSDAGEGQVRRTVQMVLAARLRPERGEDTTATNPAFWPDMDVDLKGAVLYDVYFNGCEFRRADFDEAQFEGEAHFDGARFVGEARFVGAVFLGYEVSFQEARFEAVSWFRWVAFHGYAYFQGSHFGVNAEFSRSQFTEAAYFDNMTVRDCAWFTHAVFHGSVSFQHARAESATFFLDSFRSGVDFRWAQFALPPKVGQCEAAIGQAERHWPDNWVELTAEDAHGFIDPWPVDWAAIVEKAHAAEIRAQWGSRP
ncbi:pentapeptide repeat-containing protein [Streptomyces anulatus]|uniref:pentapeptide repeat-containing protein n=1 Tax=Streptomyces TaxID=1883 RepID=UPI001B3664B0|nr:pentapeptide repeat-containing protein [Streptomyces sp. C3-3]MBQ1117640.1 pentapeptide repeat-containing protein [Streptomyces sp. C3-3]